jgi:hypothetical protein
MSGGVTFTFLYKLSFLGILQEGEFNTKSLCVTQSRLPNVIVQI